MASNSAGVVGPGGRSVGVLIAEDEAPLRAALVDLLASEPGFEVVAAVGSAAEAIEAAATLHPTVALIDVRMPGGGPAAVAGIRERSPETAALALSAYADRGTVFEMLRRGAVGYLVKGVLPGEIVDAVRRAARGQASLSANGLYGVIEGLVQDMDERHAVEDVLRRSEERFRALHESSPDAVIGVDARGTIVLANARAAEIFGYRQDELRGLSVDSLLPARARERHVEHRRTYLADPHSRPMGIGLELAGRRRDGTEFPVDISLFAIDTVDGALATAVVRDLSERQAAEQARRASDERFAALLESAPDGVAIIDEGGTIVLVNEQTERLFGYGRDELIGSSIELLVPERVRRKHPRHRSDYFADAQTRPMGVGLELAGRRRDGSEFPVDISLSALDTDDGRLGIAFVRDITDRSVEARLRWVQEEASQALVESAPDGIVICSPDGTIVRINRQIERMFGYSRGELMGGSVDLLLPERVRARHPALRESYARSPKTRPMGVGLELAGRRKDGSEFSVDVSLSAIRSEGTELLAAFVRDVTERDERVRLERDLAERRALLLHLVSAGEDERRRIAGDIHDDTIQAITAAGIRLQLLRRALDRPDQLALLGELEQTIQHSISRLRHLLFELRPPALDNEGLSAAIEMYLNQTEAESDAVFSFNDRLRSQPPPESRVILYRIAQEALTNARKHARATNVTIDIEDRDGGYLIRVADDGAGFEPGAGQPQPGHLGLAAISERATLAGGWLKIESAPGSGTTLLFWIPAAPDRAG